MEHLSEVVVATDNAGAVKLPAPSDPTKQPLQLGVLIPLDANLSSCQIGLYATARQIAPLTLAAF